MSTTLAWARRAFAEPSTSLPFSFAYGGASSHDFLADWKTTVEEDASKPNTVVRTLTLSDPQNGLGSPRRRQYLHRHPGR